MRIATLALAGAVLVAAGCSDGTSWEDGDGCEDYDEPCEEDDELLGAIVVGILAADDGDDGEDDRPGPPLVRVVRSDLLRDPAGPDRDGRGRAEIRASRRRERFLLLARRLDPYAAVEFLVEDAAGAPVSLGTRIANPAGEAGIGLSTDGWDALPGGTASLADLAGREVLLRDGEGRTLLRGRVPFLRVPPGTRRVRGLAFDPATGAEARSDLRVHFRRGRQVFDLRVGGLPPGGVIEVLVEGPGGVPVEALRGTADGEGAIRFRADSRRGDPLPLGLLDLLSLAGRGFEVRADGETVLEGRFPTLGAARPDVVTF